MKQKEIFKDIPDYEGSYQISNLSNIKSFKNSKVKILKQVFSGDYLNVTLYRNGIGKSFNVHQLMAITFLNHKPDYFKAVIDHKNFIKTDNTLKNIRVITNRENTNKKHLKSSSQHTGVCLHKQSNKWVANIKINKKVKYLGIFLDEYNAHLAYQKELNKNRILIKTQLYGNTSLFKRRRI